MSMSPRNKQHTMEDLANLSKFQGRYDVWLQIRQRYSLKWTSGNESLQALERFFNPEMTQDHMIEKVKEMMRVLPKPMAEIIRFACLTGLRPSEACESVKLLTGRDTYLLYYNQEQQCLEHFRFPEIFLRQTKKAYLSYLSIDNHQRIASLGDKTAIPTLTTPTWNAIRLACKRRDIDMDMRLCRKIFASHLRNSGMQPEVVDMLQGRVAQSVLTRHYLGPDQHFKADVLKALKQLEQRLS